VYRGGKWERLPGDALLPGDVISIGRPAVAEEGECVVPTDCLLLSGSCICEEAVLTG
jgi:cation-transporting ATPase 13A1